MPKSGVPESPAVGSHTAPFSFMNNNSEQIRKSLTPLQRQQSNFTTMLSVLQAPAKKVSVVDLDRTTPPPFEKIFVHSESCARFIQHNPSVASFLTPNDNTIPIATLGRTRTRSYLEGDNDDNDSHRPTLAQTNHRNAVSPIALQQHETTSAPNKVAFEQQQLRLPRRSVSQFESQDSDTAHDSADQFEQGARSENVLNGRNARNGPFMLYHHQQQNAHTDVVELSPLTANGGAHLRHTVTSDHDYSIRARLSNGTSPLRRSSGNSSSTVGRRNWKWLFHLGSYFGSMIGKQEWIFLVLLGVLTAMLSFSVDIIIDTVLRARLTQVDRLRNPLLKLVVWMGPSILFIMASTAVTINFAPQAIGSGIAHLKTILHGVVLKEYLSLRTLWVKVIGLTLALCSGLPIGKVGPFVHIGAIMARQLGRVREYLISDWRTKTALPGVASRKYDTVSAGCAVGLASCDASPIGGVLFAIEVTSTYFAIQNYWRGFLAALSAALTFRLLSVWLQDDFTLLPLFTTKFPIEFPFDLTELSLFVLLGAVCGVMGAMYVKLHRRVSLLHRRVPRRHKQKFAYIFPLVFAVGYTLITFPYGYGNYFVGRLWLRRAAMEFLYDSHAGVAHNTNVLPTTETTADENGEVSTITRHDSIGLDGFSDGAAAGLGSAYGGGYTRQRAQHYSSVYSPRLGMFMTTYTIDNNPYNPSNLKKPHDGDDDDERKHHVQTLSTRDGIVFDSLYNATVLTNEANDTLLHNKTMNSQNEMGLDTNSSSESGGDMVEEHIHSPTFSSTPFDDIRHHIEKFQPGASVILILCNYCLLHFFCTPISATLPVPTGTFVPLMVLGAAFGRLIGEIVAVMFPHGFADHQPLTLTDAQQRLAGNYTDNATTSQSSILMSAPVLPGAYAVVGAAAFLAGATQTISPAIIAVEMTGQVGHVIPILLAVLVATSVAKRFEMSIYESIINLLRLPYVPHLDASNEAVHRTTVGNIMVVGVRFVTHDCTYDDVRLLLAKTPPKITVFPLVDNSDTMVLIGAVLRSDLQASIETKLSFRNYLAHLTLTATSSIPIEARRFYGGKGSYTPEHKKSERHTSAGGQAFSNKPAQTAAKPEQDHYRSASSAAERTPSAQKNSRFIVQPAPENENRDRNVQSRSSSGMTRATTADTLYNIPVTNNAGGTSSLQREAASSHDARALSPQNAVLIDVNNRGARRSVRSSSTVPNENGSRLPGSGIQRQVSRTMSVSKLDNMHNSGEMMIARQYTHDSEYYKTISSSSPTSCCVMIGSRGGGDTVARGNSSRANDSSASYNADDVLTRLAWEQQVLAEQFDFSQCKVDISPMQVAETMPLAKVHLVFSLLSVNIVYVTSLGRLVGIATVSDLRRALQSSVR